MGIRAEVRINNPSGCPVVSLSEVAGATGNSIRKTSTGDADSVTEEFVLEADDPPGSLDGADLDYEYEEVFSYGSMNTYRFNRSRGGCICECIEVFGCPITDVYADNGSLVVTFHTTGIEVLKQVLGGLRDQWSDVTVTRLLHAADDQEPDDLVLIDRGELTDRQREVLEIAHEMGYFKHGQGANAGEVADALDINTSTFSEHLKAAQGKLMAGILND